MTELGTYIICPSRKKLAFIFFMNKFRNYIIIRLHNLKSDTCFTTERVIKGSAEKWSDDKIDNANQGSDIEICGDSSE